MTTPIVTVVRCSHDGRAGRRDRFVAELHDVRKVNDQWWEFYRDSEGRRAPLGVVVRRRHRAPYAGDHTEGPAVHHLTGARLLDGRHIALTCPGCPRALQMTGPTLHRALDTLYAGYAQGESISVSLALLQRLVGRMLGR